MWQRRLLNLRARLLAHGGSGVEHLQIDLVGGQRCHRRVDETVHRLPVGGLRTVLEQPTGWICQRIKSPGNGIGELDVVALVGGAGSPLRSTVDGDDDVGRDVEDRLGDPGAQLRGVAQPAVGEVPKPHIVHADNRRRPALFTLPQRPGLFGRHPGDARFAPGGQRVVHRLARRRPRGDRGTDAVLGVVGVWDEHQRRTPIRRKLLQRGQFGHRPS